MSLLFSRFAGASALLLLAPLSPALDGQPGPNVPALPERSVKVILRPFKNLEGADRLEQLQFVLPSALRLSFFSQRWLEVSMEGERAAQTAQQRAEPESAGGQDARPQFLIEGTLFEVGNRVRVRVTVKQLPAGVLVLTDSSFASDEELLPSMQALGERITDKLRSRLALSTGPPKSAGISVAVLAPFRRQGPDASPQPYPEWLPDSLATALAQLRVENVGRIGQLRSRFTLPEAGPDVLIWGSFASAKDQLTIRTTYQERGVPVLTLTLTFRVDQVAGAPRQIARQLAEVLRARVRPEGGFREERVPLAGASPQEYLEQANQYRDQGQSWRALFMYRKALELRPEQLEPRFSVASIYMGQKEYDGAAAEYKQILLLYPTSAAAEFGLGSIAFQQNSYAEAERRYEQALRLTPSEAGNRAMIYRALGDVYVVQSGYERAIDAYQKSLDADAHNPDTYRALAAAYAAGGLHGEAVAWLGKGLEALPGNAMLTRELVSSYRKLAGESLSQGDQKKALNYFGLMLALGAPQALEPGTYELVRDAYHKAGQDREAARVFRSELERNPRSSELLSVLSLLYHDYLGEYQQGYEINRRATALNPQATSPRLNLAESSLVTGRFQEALELANALLAEPGLSVAHRLSARFLTIGALLFLERRTDALPQLGEFIGYYRSLPADFEHNWLFTGTRAFVRTYPPLAAADRDLLVGLIDVLELPKTEADRRLRQIEVSLAAEFEKLRLLRANPRQAPRVAKD